MSNEIPNLEKNEISNLEEKDINKNNRCKDSIYFDEKKQEFTDLRTLISYPKLKEVISEDIPNFTDGNIVKRTANYKLQKAIDLDYCLTVRKNYSFKPIQDLYDVLWSESNKDNVNSAETLISVNRAIGRLAKDNKIIPRKNKKGPPSYDWEWLLDESNKDKIPDEFTKFFHAVATIGNFMPVPAAHQRFLNCLNERFDKELIIIKLYYLKNCKEILSKTNGEKIIKWLDSFGSGKKGWENFVNENYLDGSFVIKNKIVVFNNSLEQLTKIIKDRSEVMLEIYKEKIK